MTVREQLGYWGIGLVAFSLMMWLLADALLPFVLGAAIAYLSDPLADWLETHGLGRVLATVVITVTALSLAVLAILLFLPLLVEQARQAIADAPVYVDQARAIVSRLMPEIATEGSFLNNAVAKLRENAQEWSVSILQKVWSGGIALVNFIAVLFVTPVVAFYLLMDWDRMVEGIDEYLPRQHRGDILHIVRELDRVLAGFLRGQLTVCTILGTFYAVALMSVGLDFGLLIGVFAGLISFVPYVGSILGGLVSVGVATAQFWDNPVWIGVVAIIFVAGQAIEGNFLTPKLVGDKVGLHPVWLMFALSAFGVLFGFVGLLMAVPAAAAIGVVGRFLLLRYKEGRLYQGSPGAGDEAADDPGGAARADLMELSELEGRAPERGRE